MQNSAKGDTVARYISYPVPGAANRLRNHIFNRKVASQQQPNAKSDDANVGLKSSHGKTSTVSSPEAWPTAYATPIPSPPSTAPAKFSSPDVLPPACSPTLPSPPSTAPTKLSAATSLTGSTIGSELEYYLKEVIGHDSDSLSANDLRHCETVRAEIEQLRLNQHFNVRGGPRFRHLGLSFATQKADDKYMPFINSTKASTTGKSRCRAKAIRLAVEAVTKDAESTRYRALMASRAAGIDNFMQQGDVNAHQLSLFFCELPSFSENLPENVIVDDLLPVDSVKEDEMRMQRSIEILNTCFNDNHWIEGSRMNWLLSRFQVDLLREIIMIWQRASRGSNLSFGIDRPTFCRLILDLGLVDHQKVTVFWAVSLFDLNCVAVRAAQHDFNEWQGGPHNPLLFCLGHWKAITVLDVLIKQHFTTGDDFIAKLRNLDTTRLPEHLMRDYHTLMRGPKFIAAMTGGASMNQTMEPRKILTVPLWEREPASSANMSLRADTKEETGDPRHDMECRLRLYSSMLVEPEVLHITMENFDMFQVLHRSYADSTGHLNFPQALQFCSDYRLTPAYVSADTLRIIYDEAVAIDVIEETCNEADAHGDDEPSPVDRSSLVVPVTPTSNGSSSPRASFWASRSLTLPEKELRKSSSNRPKHPEQADVTVSKSLSKQRSLNLKVDEEVSGRTSMARTSNASAKGATPEDAGSSSPSSDVNPTRDFQLRRLPAKSSRAIYGPAAFVEMIYKVAFLYLGTYGNTPQQNSTAYARLIWLLTHLRGVVNHYERNQSRLEELSEGNAFHDSLKLAAKMLCSSTARAHELRTRDIVVDPRTNAGHQATVGRRLRHKLKKEVTQSHHDLISRVGISMGRLARIRGKVKGVLSKSRTKRSASNKEEPPDPDQDESTESEPHEEDDQELAAPVVRPVNRFSSCKRASREGDPMAATGKRVPDSNGGPAAARTQHKRGSAAAERAAASAVRTLRPQEEDEALRSSSKETGETMLCIKNHICRLCSRCLRDNWWGTATCRGCSIVDAMSLQEHPFKALLFAGSWPEKWNEGGRPKQTVPAHELQVLRPCVTPPPLSDETERVLKLFKLQEKREPKWGKQGGLRPPGVEPLQRTTS